MTTATKPANHPAKEVAKQAASQPAKQAANGAASQPADAAPRPRRGKPAAEAAELSARQQQDADYARLAEDFCADPATPEALRKLAQDPRVSVRRAGQPAPGGKCVVYWMQRSERGRDNHALDCAIHVADALGLPVVAYFAAISDFPHANLRHYAFLNQGLPDIEEDCNARGVGFVMRRAPHCDHLEFFGDVHAAMVIGDENPMRVPESWRVELAAKLDIPFWTVDSDVVVPSKLLLKAQYSAAVARPRILRAVPDYLKPFDNPHAAHPWHMPHGLRRDDVRADITAGWPDFDRSVGPVAAWQGGHHAAMKRLHHFTTKLLPDYAENRQHPALDGTSALSPYLHFGHIGPVTIALAVDAAAKADPKLRPICDGYFNEMIVWRELSVNFVRYQPDYDNVHCADNWARETIAKHAQDKRDVLYTRDQMERGETYDDLWNAAQMQMVRYGWMHNSVRMYWGKKILEWTPDAPTALDIILWLNDRYFLDGRDPNGYSGCTWAILGKFDRPWPERPIFGKRRYMSQASTGKKLNAEAYAKLVHALPELVSA